jgi:hypothetical protein
MLLCCLSVLSYCNSIYQAECESLGQGPIVMINFLETAMKDDIEVFLLLDAVYIFFGYYLVFRPSKILQGPTA